MEPTAQQRLEAVRTAEVALASAYEQPAPDRAHIAELSSKIGRGIKLAEVQALIDINRTLERLVPSTPGQYLVEQYLAEQRSGTMGDKIRAGVRAVCEDPRVYGGGQ